MSNEYLYRGVSEEMHERGSGLHPKGTSFYRSIKYGEGFKYGSGVTYGSSINNAVIAHQRNSEHFPTSGISTTPLFERAKIYALSGNKKLKGFVYKIDRSLVLKNNIKEYRVADYTKFPNIPEDNEVILVTSDSGPLPWECVIEIIPVTSIAP